MIINRYNYEEYFLLYTDNELGEAERKAVERFVEENPDLKNELLGFQSVVLHADQDVRFPGKKELLSSNASLSVINNDNYTEYFLLYADNELNNEAKAQVEQYVYHNPELQEEFELLLKVKMEADRSIIFENKEILFRQAEPARVIAGWWKITASVAAALIFILFGYLKYNATSDDAIPGRISQRVGADSQKKSTPLIVIENKVDTSESDNDEHSGANELKGSEQKSEKVFAKDPLQEKSDSPEKSVATNQTKIVKKKPETQVASTDNKGKIPEIQQNVEEPRQAAVAVLPDQPENLAPISVEHVQSLHQENLQLKASVASAKITDAQEQDSEISIAGIPVTSNSKVGNLISRTSRFINKTKQEISTRSSRVAGNFGIALR